MANRTKIENLQDLIKDSIGGKVVEQTVVPLLPPGENYGSVMYRVDFKVRNDGDGAEEEYHAVAKCTPLNTVTQELFNTQVTFKSEIAWYTTVIPTLIEFQKSHGVENGIDFFQKFYGARISLDPTSEKVDLDGVILTQNLKSLGYHNVDRHVGFDLPTSHSILRDLVAFHAVSLAIKLQNPELFDTNIKPYLPEFPEPDEEMLERFLKPAITLYEDIPECQPIIERIKKSINEANGFGYRGFREPWVAITHNDFWMNNIMVTGGKNSKTMILDLQSPYLGSPARDLVFFLLTSVKLDIIRDKYDDFVKFYFEQLCRNLKELDVPTENYTFEGLLEEIDTEVRIGELAHVLGIAFVILGDKGKAAFDSSDENFKKEDFMEEKFVANIYQIERFKWIASVAAKKNWI